MEPNDWDEKPKNDKPKRSNHDWRDLKATPQRLARLFASNELPESAWEPAQDFAGLHPTRNDWVRYLDMIMLGLGTVFLLAGIVFFFAFNWDDFTRWHRFAIVEGAVIIATLMAFFLNIDTWAGKLSLAAASILLGVALAVVGQEYQTGADSYRLFMIWCMMITGWVLISRWNIMYLMWMILLNLTIGLYWEQVIYTDWHNLNLILLCVNAGFVFLWDIIGRVTQFDFMVRGRWFLYVIMAVELSYATGLMTSYITAYQIESTMHLIPIIYFLTIGLIGLLYIWLRQDLLIVSLAAVSLLVVVITWIGDGLFDTTNEPVAIFFLMSVITISLTAAMAFGLRLLHQRWEGQNE